MPKPTSFDALKPLPETLIAPDQKPAALQAVRDNIGDCTRCPLAYAGRRHIVFADGDPNARLMFVGEGPGADEDASGIPFVGKAGQLLNNMIAAMGLKREAVYIANIVKCRPPANRTPEPVEANTCSPFLLEQIDIVRPQVIVALGATAATYLLGVKQSLGSLRGAWHACRGAKVCVTYHPAYLLRDPSQKAKPGRTSSASWSNSASSPPPNPQPLNNNRVPHVSLLRMGRVAPPSHRGIIPNDPEHREGRVEGPAVVFASPTQRCWMRWMGAICGAMSYRFGGAETRAVGAAHESPTHTMKPNE